MKPSKTTQNNQCENLIDLSKVPVLVFRMQVGTCFRPRDAELKTKTRPLTRTLKPDDLKLLGQRKDEPLKKLKSSRLQMFFKIGNIKHFAIFIGKELCWGLFLMKLEV